MSDLKTQRESLINDFKGIQQKIRQYVDNLKQKGSEELLNGSVEKAQNLIGAIIPIESAVKKIQVDQDDLLKVLESQDEDSEESEKVKGADKNASENEKVVEDKSEPESYEEEPVEESEESDEEKEEEQVNEKNSDDTKANEEDLTPQEAFRLPILKALIYLGGSGKVKDVTNFIEKDMKNKFRAMDNEVLNGDGQKEWVKRVSKEQEDMLEEGLLNSDADEGQWEIAQAGIDYLAKNKKNG